MHACIPFQTIVISSVARLLAVVLGLTTTSVAAQTTRYSTPWGGGTITPSETVEILDGGSITGNVVANGSLVFNRSAALTVAGTVSGTGGLEVVKTGTITLTGLTSGTGFYDLRMAVSGGELAINTSGSGSFVVGHSGTGTLVVNGGVMRSRNAFFGLNAGSRGDAIVSSGLLTTSTRTLHVGHSGSGSLLVSGGAVNTSTLGIGSIGGTGVVTVTGGTLAAGGPLYLGGFTGTVSGTGTGTLSLSGGRLTSANAWLSTGTGSVATALVTGGTWFNSANMTLGRDPQTVASLTISGSGGTGGTVIVGGTLSTGTGGTISLRPGGTLQIGTGTSAFGTLAVDLVNDGTLVFSRTGTSTVARSIAGTGAVATSGSGVFLFSGTSTYTGPTAVGAGRMLVNGELGSTAVSVNSGGLLGGTGMIRGGVSVNAGGTLAPGVTIESLATGDVSLFDGGMLASDIDSRAALPTAADLLRITGDLSLVGTVNLAITDLATTPVAFADGTTLSLISYSGLWNGGLLSLGGAALFDGANFTVGSQRWMIDYDASVGGANFVADQLAGGSFVNIIAVPEPTAIALAFAALGYAGIVRPRRSAARRACATVAASTGNGMA